MKQQEKDAATTMKAEQKKKANAPKDPFALNYIKSSEDEIFKNLPKQAKKQAPGPTSFYANLEDIMMDQGPKKKKWVNLEVYREVSPHLLNSK